MSIFTWAIFLILFVQPIYFIIRCIYAKVNNNQDQFTAYFADFKSWLLQFWDLVKWKR